MRVWKETYLPLLEILNSIFLGFLFFFTIQETSHVSFHKEPLLGNYPEILVFSLFALMVGYLIQLILQKVPDSRKDSILATIMIGLMGWFITHLNRPMLMETIFHANELRVGIIVLFLAIGFLVSGLQQAQMGGFLLGNFLFSIGSLFLDLESIHYKKLSILLLASGGLNLGFRHFLELQNQFLPSRRRKRDFKLFSGLYSSFSVLLIINLVFTSIRGFSSFQLSAFLFLFAYLVFRTYAIYRMDETFFRSSFVWGRNLLVLNFILFAGSFTWESFSWVLYFNLGACLGFFKPEKPIYRKRIQTLMVGFVSIAVLLGVIQLGKIQFYFIHLESLLIFLVFLPLLSSARLDPVNIHLPIVVGFLISIYLFKAPTVQTFRVIPEQKAEVSLPIPYLLTDLWNSDSQFKYIQSGLPTESLEGDYPNLSELEGYTPVLGDNPDDNYLNYYKRFLDKNDIPYYLISTLNKKESGEDGTLSYNSFPGFKIYYSSKLKKPEWNSRIEDSKKFNYLMTQLEGIDDFREYPPILRKMEIYNYSIRKEISIFRDLIQESIHNYCNYYYKNKFYSETLQCLSLEMKFGKLNEESLHQAYDSLNYTTPSYSHVDLLEEVSGIDKYKIPILKKIYPIYNSAGDQKKTLDTLQRLIHLTQNSEAKEELSILEQKITRIYLEMDKLESAYPLIQSGLRSGEDNLIWERLKDEYEEKKIARRRAWLPPPLVDTTEID